MPSEFRAILTYLEEQSTSDDPEALMLRLLNIYPTLKEGKETKEDNIYFTKSTKLQPAGKDDPLANYVLIIIKE